MPPITRLATKSREVVKGYFDRERFERKEEDAAVERAVRAFELEAAKQRIFSEKDLREFARTVFRLREYRSQKAEKWKSPDLNVIMSNVTNNGTNNDTTGTSNNKMRTLRREASALATEEGEVETTVKNGLAANINNLPPAAESFNASFAESFCSSVGGPVGTGADVMSLPYYVQRRLVKSMYKVCISSAFYFTKRFMLPLTLNAPSPFPPITRLSIQDLTEAIMDAYNTGTIPPTSVDENIVFGFAAVFQTAVVLDDAILYFSKDLSDRRIRSILLAGIDLVNALRDKKASDEAENIMAECEEYIEDTKRQSWERDEDEEMDDLTEREDNGDEEDSDDREFDTPQTKKEAQ